MGGVMGGKRHHLLCRPSHAGRFLVPQYSLAGYGFRSGVRPGGCCPADHWAARSHSMGRRWRGEAGNLGILEVALGRRGATRSATPKCVREVCVNIVMMSVRFESPDGFWLSAWYSHGAYRRTGQKGAPSLQVIAARPHPGRDNGL